MSQIISQQTDFSCGGVVRDTVTQKILLIQVENLSHGIVWTFPKGHPEKGESEHEAALREVREETGWDCKILKHLLDVDYFFTRDHIRTHKTVRWFLMEPKEKVGDFNPGEVKQCDWVSPKEIRLRISYDSDHKILDYLGY